VETPRNQLFRDPTVLTWWLIGLLLFAVLIGLAALVSSLMQYGLLGDMQSGAFHTREEMTAAATTNDFRQRALSVVFTLAVLVREIVFFFWIYRASVNARQLGAKDMEISPGWAVGWFFIPFANLWMPFQAMSEIWNASASPVMWRQLRTPVIVAIWWCLWLGVSFLGLFLTFIGRGSQKIEDLRMTTVVVILFYVVAVSLDAVMLAMVRTVYNRQVAHHKFGIAEVFA